MSQDEEKPFFRLKWSDPLPPTKGVCSYDHVTAETPFGGILITWKGWKEFDAPTVDEHPIPGFFYAGYDVDDAKQKAEEAYFAAFDCHANHLELLKKYMKYCEAELNAREVVRGHSSEFTEQEASELYRLENLLTKEWINEC